MAKLHGSHAPPSRRQAKAASGSSLENGIVAASTIAVSTLPRVVSGGVRSTSTSSSGPSSDSAALPATARTA